MKNYKTPEFEEVKYTTEDIILATAEDNAHSNYNDIMDDEENLDPTAP